MEETKLITQLSKETSKLVIGDKEFFMYEMPVKRLEVFLLTIESTIKSFMKKNEDKNPILDIVAIIGTIPSELVELFNFVCFPKECSGCNGYKSFRCKECKTMESKKINLEWFEQNITPRILIEIYTELIKQNNLEGIINNPFLQRMKESFLSYVMNQMLSQKPRTEEIKVS